MTRRLRLIGCSLFAGVVFLACGGDGDKRSKDAPDAAAEVDASRDAGAMTGGAGGTPSIPDSGVDVAAGGTATQDSGHDARMEGGGGGPTPVDGAPPDTGGEAGTPPGTCEAPRALLPVNAGDTTDATDVLHSTCSSTLGSGQEIVFVTTAPANGRYELELSSSADLGISVRRECSNGDTELACVDEFPGGEERLVVPVSAGEPLFIVVEGWNATQAGAFGLDAPFVPADCGDGVLDGGEACDDGDADDGDGCSASCAIEACFAPGVLETSLSGDTSGVPSVLSTSCANALSGGEDIYAFTAPVAGVYRFDLVPSGSADFVLALRAACDSAEGETCVDDGFGGANESAERTLEAGETIFVVVEGWGTDDEGAYTLEVTAGG